MRPSHFSPWMLQKRLLLFDRVRKIFIEGVCGGLGGVGSVRLALLNMYSQEASSVR